MNNPGQANLQEQIRQLVQAGQTPQAIELCRRAIAADANPDAGLLRDYGVLLLMNRQTDEAAPVLERAQQQRPNDPELLLFLASICNYRSESDKALALVEKAMSIAPDFPAAYGEKSRALIQLRRLDEAQAALDRMVKLLPDSPQAHVTRGMLLLLRGHFDQGWSEYEWRLRLPRMKPPPLPDPPWDGSPLAGKSIRLHAEQGYGDAIQFVRFARTLSDQGAKVVLRCQVDLEHLLSRCPGVHQTAWHGQPIPICDFHVPLLSLPHLLALKPDAIPSQVPYVFADPKLAGHWQQRLPMQPKKLRVGLCWAGRTSHDYFHGNRNRSIPVSALAPLAECKHVQCVSLQHPFVKPAELPFPMIDPMPHARDFSDTAAIMHHLDLIISNDTAVAHLAGAMGKMAWTLLIYTPDFRWGLDRPDSPWYPTMELFRQQKPGNWSGTIDELKRRLLALPARAE